MLTKLCDFCGKEIPVNSKICPFCNKALEEKVFTYMSENKPKSDSANGLDVSKYITRNDDKPAEDYFKTNVYSYSEQEIEKTFERKDVVYDEEERESQNMRYRMQRDYVPRKENKAKDKKKNKKKNNKRHRKGTTKTIIALLVILLIIIGVVGLVVFKPFSSDKTVENTPTTIKTTETTTVETTTETTTEETTVASSPATYSNQSVDLDGYLGLSYSSFKSNFDASPRNSDNNEIFGGSNYYYDGMTVSTDSNGKIQSIEVDYATASDKDMYRYQDITYYSYYDQVIDEFGTPDLDQLNDKTEPCIGYTLDVGSGLSIKFKFDDNKKVTGYSIFYAD